MSDNSSPPGPPRPPGGSTPPPSPGGGGVRRPRRPPAGANWPTTPTPITPPGPPVGAGGPPPGGPPPGGTPPPPPGYTPGPTPTPDGGGNGRRTGLLVGGAAIVLALVAGGIYLLTSGDDDDDDAVPTTEVTLPGDLTVPDLTDPVSTIPQVTQPGGVTIPELSIPDFTIPDVSVPDFSMPDFTIPDFTLPDFSIPDFTIPDIPGLPTEIPPATQQPDGLGDDETLNQLAEFCYGGGLIACDELYTVAPVGSPYEAFGDTCAGRQPAETNEFCSALAGFPPPTIAPTDLETEDQSLLQLAARCWAGNMQACVDLSGQAPAGSPEQSFGETCAGREDEGATTPCTEAHPEWMPLYDPSLAPVEPGVPDAGEPDPPDGLGSDPALDQLAQSCFEGDFVACDDLYWQSDIDSGYEIYAETCGGRVDEAIAGQCEETYG